MPSPYGNNPYGTLGPSPGRVATISPTIRPTAARPAVKPKGMSPQQWAEEQVRRIIDAQVASINEQRKIYLDELTKRSQLEAQRGMALAQALRGMDFPGRIQSIYGAAQHDTAGLAQGFSGAMQGIANADAAQQAHMLSGTGQEGAVRNEGVGMADVNYGAQGFIPGRALGETGAAFAAQAALEPAFAAQMGQLEAGRVHQEGLQGLDDFTKALIEIRSQRPQLVQDFLDKRQSMILDQQKFALDRQDAQREWYLKLAALEMSRGNSARADQYLKLANSRQNLSVAKANMQNNKNKGLDASGALLPGFAMKGGRVVKVPTPKSKGKGSTSSTVPGTPAYNAAAMQKVGSAQKNIEADIKVLLTKPTAADIQAGADPFTTKKPPYQKAFNQLWSKYKYLGTTAAAKKALREAIVRALAAAGIQPVRSAPIGSSPGHL